MRKILLIISVIVVFAVFIYGAYRIATFSLFDAEFVELKSIEVPNKQYRLMLFLITSNASSENYVQVRKIESTVEEVLMNYEGYNYVEDDFIRGDSVFFVLKDTSLSRNKSDTLSIKLP
jgi:hypothetical protein